MWLHVRNYVNGKDVLNTSETVLSGCILGLIYKLFISARPVLLEDSYWWCFKKDTNMDPLK